MRIIFLCLISVTLLCSCTISVLLTNTHGTATDVVDSTPTTETKTDAQVEIPVKAI